MKYLIEKDAEKLIPSNNQGSNVAMPNDVQNNNLSKFL